MLELDVGQDTAQLSDLLQALDQGQTIALVRNGITIAQVVPTPGADPEKRKEVPSSDFMKNRLMPIKNLTWQDLYSWRHETSNPCQE